MPTDEGRSLQLISRARKALAEANTIAEVKTVRDMGHSAIAHAKRIRVDGLDATNDAYEIVLRAERRLGTELDKNGPKAGRPGKGNTTLPLDELGISKMQSSRWQTEAAVPKKLFEAWLKDTRESGQQLTSAALIKLGMQQPSKAGGPPGPGPDLFEGVVPTLGELIEAEKTFACIYADPPWRYGNQATRAATDNHYPTMTVDEIAAEPVAGVAAENCHLHLWTTNAFLFEAKRVIEAWGFEYKSCLVWVKPQMGIGNYWRVSHEFLLFGLRGRLPFRDRGQMSWRELKRTKHSRKPREIREAVEKVSPGPYLEMYGREAIENWCVYGNQIEPSLF